MGAGAAGLVAAIFAARSGADTLLIESTADGGRKILISGGGRCNILPARLDESRFVTDSPRALLRRILGAWPLEEQIEFFEREAGIPLAEEKESAKLFPASNRARDVRDGLFDLARRDGVRLQMKSRVTGLEPQGDAWRISCSGGPGTIEADRVILATGGLSVPATGSDGQGLEIAARLGLAVNPLYAALTPVLSAPAPFASLAGVSLPVRLSAKPAGAAPRGSSKGAESRGGFLFTHRGYSGPTVLDVSHVLVRAGMDRQAEAAPARARLIVKWTDLDETAWDAALRSDGTRTIASVLRARLPERLAGALARAADVEPSTSLAELRREDRIRLVRALTRHELPWTGHEGYKKAEVTGGGVRLSEIDPATMECRTRPGLHLCGEMLDAFGPIGGYNFFWAWTTGRSAGMAAGMAARRGGTHG